MKQLALICCLIAFNQIHGQEKESSSFMKWFLKAHKVKRVMIQKLPYAAKEFTPLSDNIPYSQVELRYPENICYHIAADSTDCISLSQVVNQRNETWTVEQLRKVKLYQIPDKRKKFWRLSEPLFFEDFAIIVIITKVLLWAPKRQSEVLQCRSDSHHLVSDVV
ncbi:MAG: hypothetical protein AAGI38_21095 [Bacteroidota bacterium]